MLSRLKWFGLIPAPKFLFFTPISVSDYNPTIVTDSREHEVTPNTVVSGALFAFHIEKGARADNVIWKKHDSHPEQVEKLLRGFFNWLNRDNLEPSEHDLIIPNFIYYVKRHEELWDEQKGIIHEGKNWETDKHLRKYLKLYMPSDTDSINSRFIYHIYFDTQTADIYEGRLDQPGGGSSPKVWVRHEKKGTINVGGTGNAK